MIDKVTAQQQISPPESKGNIPNEGDASEPNRGIAWTIFEVVKGIRTALNDDFYAMQDRINAALRNLNLR